MSSANIELVRRLFEAFNAGDVIYAEDAEQWPAPGTIEGGPFKGRDKICRFFEGLGEGWKPGTGTVVVRELEEAGDRVLASFRWRAIGDVSGLEVSSDWTSVTTIRGGQVVRVQYLIDRDAAINAAGLK